MMEKSTKHDLKYYISESITIGTALTMSSLTAAFTDKITDSDAIISVASAIGGTSTGILANILTYGLLHINEYKKGTRNFKQDMKAFAKSHTEGLATTYSIRIPFQYVLQKYGVPPPTAALIAYITGGAGGTIMRNIRNYQRKIFGDKKADEMEIQKHDNLERLLNPNTPNIEK